MNENERQAFHIFIGAVSIALVLTLGVQLAAYAVGAVLILGLLLVHMKLSGLRLGLLEWLVARFERPGVTPGYGAMTMAAGVLAVMTLISNPAHILASLCILGSGDAASTLVGRRSKRTLPHNRKKTWGGSLAFFIASLPAVYFAGWQAIVVAALAAVAESMESDIDDNLIVSVVCVVAFRLLGG